MTQIRFSEIANDELIDACDWYERQQEGLGLRFKNAVRDAAQRIARTPLLFQLELEDVRRYESVSLYLALCGARG